jgi:flagellar hook-length control protein FliK
MTVMLTPAAAPGTPIAGSDASPSGDSGTGDTFAAVLAQTSDEPTPAAADQPAGPVPELPVTTGASDAAPTASTAVPTGQPVPGKAAGRPNAGKSAEQPATDAQAIAALLVGQPVPAPVTPSDQAATSASRSTVAAVSTATTSTIHGTGQQPAAPAAGQPATPIPPGQPAQPAQAGQPAPAGQVQPAAPAPSQPSQDAKVPSADPSRVERSSLPPSAAQAGQPVEPSGTVPAAPAPSAAPAGQQAAAEARVLPGQPVQARTAVTTGPSGTEPSRPVAPPKVRMLAVGRATEQPAVRLEASPAAGTQSTATHQPDPSQLGPGQLDPSQNAPSQLDPSQIAPTQLAPTAAQSSMPSAPNMPNPVAQQLVTPLLRLRSGGDGSHSLTVALHPAELGPVNLHVRLAGDVMTIQLASTNESARDALRDALPQLHQELQAAGLPSAGLSLELSGQAPGGSQHFGTPDRPAPDRPAPEQPAPPAAKQESRARGTGSGLDRWL